jgi:ComF family protein
VTSCVRSIGPYEGALRAIVHALKYGGCRSIAPALGRLMRDAGADLLTHDTVIVPVPLHAAKKRRRGFNQADDLARHLGPRVVPALSRVRHTGSQTALTEHERQANVRGAFVPDRRWRDWRGAPVVLVDDVRTTGATLDACALALREAGAGEVSAITAARVETTRA